jgi:hypothetical protein
MTRNTGTSIVLTYKTRCLVGQLQACYPCLLKFIYLFFLRIMWCQTSPFKPLRYPLEAHVAKSRLWQNSFAFLWFYNFQTQLYHCILSLHRSLWFCFKPWCDLQAN